MTIIAKDIHWVGIIEWDLKFFHGHELSIKRGTSYNSYLIKDEKTALIDSVRSTRTGEFIRNLEEVVPVEKIDYFVVNHAEPDHSGALPELLKRNPQAVVIVSKGGETSFKRHYPGSWNVQVVRTGDSISLGHRTLRFFEAQMLHWPDSMFTYCPEDRILFPNDAFGQHFADSRRFADEVDSCELWQEAMKYFANILTPFSGQIIRKIQEFLTLGWSVEMICPSHGQMWRKDVNQIVQKYVDWASGKGEKAAVLIYDTIWGGTERMAKAVAEGLVSEGVGYRIFPAGSSDFNDVMTEILKVRGVLVGSPTLNNGLMPTLMPYLEMMRGLRFQNKIGGAFGTYGWSGETVKRLEEALKAASMAIPVPGIRAQFSPQDADLKTCREFGAGFARAVKAD